MEISKMCRLILLGIALTISLPAAPTLAQEVSYTIGSYGLKDWNGHKYYETSITCNNKKKDKNKTVAEAGGGFGTTAYFANEVPFEYTDKKNSHVMTKESRFGNFDAAAKKACS
jgi:hypothetical protein